MIFLLLYFIAEFLVSLKVGMIIGFGWSVVWIVATSIIGALLLKFSPYAIMDNLQHIGFKNFDLRNAQNAIFAYIFGAIFLIIPGVLSDILGIFLLLYSFYLRLFAKMPPDLKNKGDMDVIDVEIIDEFNSSNSNIKRK
ncbi:MAG: FxsA family protein [Epsilonproteobacteria bacterium]|nr:FxsA family protein [Campylobacterota bacterium]